MIKSIYRSFVLGFFVLGFRCNIYADDNTALIESINENVINIVDITDQKLEDQLWNLMLIGDQLDAFKEAFDGDMYSLLFEIQDNISPNSFDISVNTASILESIDQILNANNEINNTLGLFQGDVNSTIDQKGGFQRVYDAAVESAIESLDVRFQTIEEYLIQLVEGQHQFKDGHDNSYELQQQQLQEAKNLTDAVKQLSVDASKALTRQDLEEVYDEHKIFNFFEGAFNLGDLSFSPFYTYQDDLLDIEEPQTFEVQETTSTINTDNIFSLLGSALEVQSKISAADNKSLILISKILKGKDRTQDIEEAENELNELEGKKQELLSQLEDITQPIAEKIKVEDNKLKNYDFSLSDLNDISSVNLPATIDFGGLGISHIFGIDIGGLKSELSSLDITSFHPMIEACRACSEVILYVFLGLFLLWILNMLSPKLVEFTKLIKSITTW